MEIIIALFSVLLAVIVFCIPVAVFEILDVGSPGHNKRKNEKFIAETNRLANYELRKIQEAKSAQF